MVKANNDAGKDDARLALEILALSEAIYRELKLSIPPEWLASDMTVAQLRVMLFLHEEGPSRMGTIASSLGITISTATGIVENLVRKGLVERNDDPNDRRLVICTLSPRGQGLINRVWTAGQESMAQLITGLSHEELTKAAEVAGFLLDNVRAKGKGD